MARSYGRRARDILHHAKLWQLLTGKIVLGENVAQAAQFAGSGAADAGLIARALARAPRYASLVNHATVPATWHKPLRQRMVRLSAAGRRQQKTADRFYAFMGSPAARAVLLTAGFDLPNVKGD